MKTLPTVNVVESAASAPPFITPYQRALKIVDQYLPPGVCGPGGRNQMITAIQRAIVEGNNAAEERCRQLELQLTSSNGLRVEIGSRHAEIQVIGTPWVAPLVKVEPWMPPKEEGAG